jgi:hypothetical protein
MLGFSGVAYWICSRRIRQNNRAAAAVALVLAWIHQVFVSFLLLLSIPAIFLSGIGIFGLILFGALFRNLWNLIHTLRECVSSFEID